MTGETVLLDGGYALGPGMHIDSAAVTPKRSSPERRMPHVLLTYVVCSDSDASERLFTKAMGLTPVTSSGSREGQGG